MVENKALELGGKAVEQLDSGLRRGPIIRIISVLSVALIFSIGFNIKLLLDSRDREIDLMERVVEEVRKQVPVAVQDEVQPIKEQVGKIITKTDTTLNKTDSLLNKVNSIIKK